MPQILTERRQDILRHIYFHLQENGRPPTVRELQRAVGARSTAVIKHHLDWLEKGGYIERDSRASRGVRLTPKALAWLAQEGLAPPAPAVASEIVRIPIAGYIVAGEPVFAEPTLDEDVDILELTRDILPDETDMYALRVRGDSMVDASVHDGDLVILRRQEEARNGDMVAVWLRDDQETTLKYFYQEGPYVRLQPANPAYEPILKPAEAVQIQGKVMAIIRRVAPA
ncbi:MAG: transcriptional repressor LexA [Chloroflexi bacterium]|nr:transcriptional repressor LexA [Chloroflexota bacterium]